MKILVVLMFVAVIVGVVLLSGLLWMLGLGILAKIFDAPSLAIGFWESVVVGLFVNMVLGGIGASSRKSD